jgi:hypothetical protein
MFGTHKVIIHSEHMICFHGKKMKLLDVKIKVNKTCI